MEHYSSLGLEVGASRSEIRKAFLRLSIIYHPDKREDGDDTMFKRINTAYEILYKNNTSVSFDQKSNVGLSELDKSDKSDKSDNLNNSNIVLDEYLMNYLRRHVWDKYSNAIDAVVDEIQSQLPTGIAVTNIPVLIFILGRLGQLATVIKGNSICLSKLLSLLNYLNGLPIEHLCLDDLNSDGYFNKREKVLLSYSEIIDLLPHLDKKVECHPDFTQFINRLEKLKPKLNIIAINSHDWDCKIGVSVTAYLQKSWRVSTSSYDQQLKWNNNYGFNLSSTSLLNRQDRKKLNNLLMNYILQ